MDLAILDMHTTTADGIVRVVKWGASKTAGDHTAVETGIIETAPIDPSDDSFIEFDALTPEIVYGWLRDILNLAAIESNLDRKLNEMENPEVVSGFPSSWESLNG